MAEVVVAAWNANGLANRLDDGGAVKELRRFLTERRIDVLGVSEVRATAKGQPGCKRGDGTPRERGVVSPLDKDAIRLQGALRRPGAAARPGGLAALWSARGGTGTGPADPGGVFGSFDAWFSLSDWKYAGTALLVRRDSAVGAPIRLVFNLGDRGQAEAEHDDDGRVIFAEFDHFSFLHTYSPNNGRTVESFDRRRRWDQAVTDFLVAERRRNPDKPLVYGGDLNVAPADADLSDPDFFRSQHASPASGDADDAGQPGCTNNERRRFAAMVGAAGLCDAFRQLHPASATLADEAGRLGPYYTWRGTPGREFAEFGRFYGKAMRIDHFLVSADHLDRVAAVDIAGAGADRRGFFGSDHCPVVLTLQTAARPAKKPRLEE